MGKKISALTSLATPAVGDLIPIIDISEPSDASKSKQTTAAALVGAIDPKAHAASHATGQADALAAADIGAVPTARTIATTAPLAGGGQLSGNLTLSISPATGSAAGSQSAADKALDTAEHTVRAVSGTTATLAATDGYLDVTTTAGAYTVTGPGGTGVRSWVVSKVTTDANPITLARAGSETINGAASNLVLPDSTSTVLPSWTVRRDATGNLRVL